MKTPILGEIVEGDCRSLLVLPTSHVKRERVRMEGMHRVPRRCRLSLLPHGLHGQFIGSKWIIQLCFITGGRF